MPGRMVRSQEPRARQTSPGEATARYLQQSLSDDAGLDEDVIGVDLSLGGVAVFERLAVEVLVAVAAPAALHLEHPEVIRE